MKLKNFLLFIIILGSLISLSSASDIYTVNVNWDFQKIGATSPTIQLITTNMPLVNSAATLNFSFGLNYNGIANCNFSIDGLSVTSQMNLSNGQHDWKLYCENSSNSLENNFFTGNFAINENFELNISRDFFLIYNGGFYDNGNISVNSNEVLSGTLQIFRNGIYQNFETLTPSTHFWTIDELVGQSGNYTVKVTFTSLAQPVIIEKYFTVGEAKIEILNSTNDRKVGNEIHFNVSVDSLGKVRQETIFDMGESNPNLTYYLTSNSALKTIFKKIYSQSGNKNINLFFNIGSNPYNLPLPLTITSSKDEEPPVIKLISPKDDVLLDKKNITFKYNVEDDVYIKNCSFVLYNATINGFVATYNDSDKVFPLTASDRNIAIIQNLGKSKIVNLTLKDFDERDYAWEITCYDNSSNEASEIEFFSAGDSSISILLQSDTNTYPEQKEVEYLISAVNRYLEEEMDFSPEEKEVAKYLGISENVTLFKKKLLQIDQDLKHNLNFISDVELKKSREDELRKQIKEIKNRIPLNIEIKDNYEFIKNSVGVDFDELVNDYAKGTNTILSSKEKKDLAKTVEELQNELKVETSLKQVEITYNDSKEELTLVVKKITIDHLENLKILEIIPKEIASDSDEVNFLVKNKVIKKDPIFSVDLESLEEDELIYSLKGYVNFEDLENTETVAFIETSGNSKGTITGYFISDISGSNPVYYAILILLGIVVLFGAIIIFKKFRKVKFERDPNADKIIDNISRAFRLLKQKDIEGARESYHKISAIYPVLMEDAKRYLYGQIIQVYRAIERYDLIDLLREYKNAKRQFRKEESQRIYAEIQQIYKHLSKKDQKKLWKTVRDI